MDWNRLIAFKTMFTFLAHMLNKFKEFVTLTNILTLACTIPTGLLTFDIVADFLIRKPTSTSQKQVDAEQCG